MEFMHPKRVSSGKWLSRLAEKSPLTPLSNGQRSVRTLPFTESTFRLISKRLFVHHTISAIVSRANIPTFSSAEVQMEGENGNIHTATVYNCRSSNDWEMDLALTATHFPKQGLTFALLLGCPLSIEEEVIRRLSRVSTESSYPLVLPGIFVELERSRHVAVAEKMIDQLENRISELDYASGGTKQAHMREMNQAKRENYLDTSYLRNGLVSWRNQLIKMAKQAELLEDAMSGREVRASLGLYPHSNASMDGLPVQTVFQMRRTGRKVVSRLQSIIDEYDDKIRDCTMRLDGMAMATQWSVFSMSFFTWFDDDGNSRAQVSSFVWIYVLFALVSTTLTIGSWYHFNIWRKHSRRISQGDASF
ncbi:hypothetical protein J7T55_003142 [Diaporthe amygdali]|uniref:uncharacterized protein n=1 Tax=Phomopsis amygdali TaxID=1214568 RepID=UPI0022FEECB8|nr:uncharacterized protein J7T55_003142 [Diaporthe amygdali]KAJ0122627.1 hypothetical protein J7T55_003142 [Diaporthe amygdali]